jgi:hypothetical protein
LAGPEAYLNKPFYNASKTRTVRPRVERFALNSVSGLDIDGGTVLFNYGNGLLPASNNLAVTATAGATSITLVSASSFPSVYPYEITIDSGTRKSETLLVTNKVGNVLTLGGGTYGVKFTHQAGAYVYFIPGDFEQIDYFDVDSNELCFNPSIMLKYSHYPSETVIDSSVYSDPRDDGYDFPFRVPVDIAARLEYLLDLIRAAGIRVEIISKR